jgi:hypothetical protein
MARANRYRPEDQVGTELTVSRLWVECGRVHPRSTTQKKPVAAGVDHI